MIVEHKHEMKEQEQNVEETTDLPVCNLMFEAYTQMTIADFAKVRDRWLTGTATENEILLLTSELHHDGAFETGFSDALKNYDLQIP